MQKRIVGFKRTINLRRHLRKNATPAERLLWKHLHNRRLGGLKIRRQYGVGPYIADFYHAETQTVIEVDGDIHFADEKQVEKDQQRKIYLQKHGYRIIRINNVEVINNLPDVLEHLYHNLTLPSP